MYLGAENACQHLWGHVSGTAPNLSWAHPLELKSQLTQSPFLYTEILPMFSGCLDMNKINFLVIKTDEIINYILNLALMHTLVSASVSPGLNRKLYSSYMTDMRPEIQSQHNMGEHVTICLAKPLNQMSRADRNLIFF